MLRLREPTLENRAVIRIPSPLRLQLEELLLQAPTSPLQFLPGRQKPSRLVQLQLESVLQVPPRKCRGFAHLTKFKILGGKGRE